MDEGMREDRMQNLAPCRWYDSSFTPRIRDGYEKAYAKLSRRMPAGSPTMITCFPRRSSAADKQDVKSVHAWET
jgi:hypothetical protein